MYCGDMSVQRLTGVDYLQVRKWIGAYRESVGKRAEVHRGGTRLTELTHALARAGYVLTEHSGPPKRMRLRDWAREHRSGRWLIRQHGHWFALRNGEQIRAAARRSPNAILVEWWRVVPTKDRWTDCSLSKGHTGAHMNDDTARRAALQKGSPDTEGCDED